MVNISYKKVVFFLLILFTLGFVLASFNLEVPKYSIDTIYGEDFNITGWINIGFSDEPLNSLVEDSFDNSLTLKEILDLNPAYDYNCEPIGCGNAYSHSDAETTKILNLKEDSEEFIGFVLNGKIATINSIKFVLESNSTTSSCLNHVKLDILNDDIIDVRNNKTSSEICTSKNYGCFNPSSATEEYSLISGANYCQRFSVEEAPSFNVGAWIKKAEGSGAIEMNLYDSYGFEIGKCTLSAITSEQEYSCEIEHTLTSKEDYYGCVYYPSGTGSYKIKANSASAEKCGFYGRPIKTETSAYDIFIQSKKFGAPGTISVTENLPDGRILSAYIQDYLIDYYGTSGGFINCENDCIVPLKIISGANQKLTFKNLEINYEKETGVITENKFSKLTEIPAKITSTTQKLYLDDAELKVPSNKGEYDFEIYIDGKSVFSESIEIQDAPTITSITPTKTASAYPTDFKIKISSKYNLSKYEWEFGDNDTEITFNPQVQHIYSSTGNYTLKVKVTDVQNIKSSKNFLIEVESPKKLIASKLNEMESNINKVRSDLQELELFYQQGFDKILNLNETEAKIEILKKQYADAETEEDYNLIVGELIKMNVPKNIIKTMQADDFTFFSDLENIDLDIVQAIAGGTYENSKYERYLEAISAWEQENLDMTISFSEFSSERESSAQPIMNFFEIKIIEKNIIEEEYYLIIPNMENLGFSDSNMIKQDDYYYLSASGGNQISFYTTEDIDLFELPAFIAPSLGSLSLREDLIIGDFDSRIGILLLALFLLIVIGLTSYLILQEWYKRRYENYLFPNRNDLYNMIHYVNNAKKKNIENRDIEKNLRKAGWSSERVSFVMKRYAGRRTGMFEIPIDKLWTKFSKKLPHDSEKK